MTYRVYMRIERVGDWFQVCFMAIDLKQQVRPVWYTSDKDRLLDLFERGAESKQLHDKQAFEMAIQNGRGACWLRLSKAQYRKLQAR